MGGCFGRNPRSTKSSRRSRRRHDLGPIVLHEGPHKENLEVGDQRFREGAYNEALGAYREVLEDSHGVLRGALQYRLALCQEALGNVDKAIALYRQVVADETYPQGHVPAQLAQARLLLHTGRYAEAKHYLYPLLFTVDAYPQQRSFANEARYYLALALAQSLPSAKTGAGSWKVVSPFAIPYELTLDLPDIPLPRSDEPALEEGAHGEAHAKPEPKVDEHGDGDAKPEPKADTHGDGHAKPEPKVEPHGDGHVKPEPKVNAQSDEHAKPEPKAEPHGDDRLMPEPQLDGPAEPELKFEPYREGPAKPGPKIEPKIEPREPNRVNPEAKIELPDLGPAIPELMPVPHDVKPTKSEPKADPGEDPAKPDPKLDRHGDENGKPERKVEAHEVGHEKHDAHADAKPEPHAEPHAEKHAEPKAEPEVAELLVVAPARPGTPPIVRRGRLPSQPAKTLLDRLAAAGKVKLEWSAAAEKLVGDRMVRIDVVQWPLHDLVHLLADSLELVSWTEGDVVRFATPAESPKELVEASRWNLVQLTARTALLAAPHHVLAPAIAIHLGRLELNADRTTQAILCYEEAIRRQVRGPWTISAWYDLGIVHSGRGDVHLARKAFFAAIDQSPGHPLAPLAYAHIARLEIEEGSLGPALTTLSRVRRNYPNDPTQAAVSVLTSLALTQGGHFVTARQTLVADRKNVVASPYRNAGALVEAYALYRLAKLESNARPESGRLIEALYMPEGTMTAALETEILGKACREIGMAPEAARIYANTLAWYKGPLRPTLELGHAECLLKCEKRDEAAATILRGLEAGPRSKWSAEASFRLAEIELDDGNAQASADRCRKLWNERQLADPSRIFAVWGNAQEALGEFEKASRCFAGNPPE